MENEKQELNTPNSVRVFKKDRKRKNTTLNINAGIQGDSIEIMMERLREGEGEDAIEDRDLVYNDNESATVNPITNIRTDPFEARLEEKIGHQEHKAKKLQRTKEAEKERKEEESKKKTEEINTNNQNGDQAKTGE